MTGRGPTKRLLIAPVLLLAVLLIALTSIEGMRDPAPDAGLRVEVPPVVEPVEVGRCTRDGDPQAAGALRAALGPEPVVSSSMIVACPQAFDGLQVRYRGELVGDLLRRESGAWVLVNDDPYALEVGPLPTHGEHRGASSGLSVWLPDALTDAVDGLGRPGQRGDVVLLTGRVERTDPQDGGGLTLRADSLEVLAPAVHVEEPLDHPQAYFALGAVVVAAGLWLARRHAAQ